MGNKSGFKTDFNQLHQEVATQVQRADGSIMKTFAGGDISTSSGAGINTSSGTRAVSMETAKDARLNEGITKGLSAIKSDEQVKVFYAAMNISEFNLDILCMSRCELNDKYLSLILNAIEGRKSFGYGYIGNGTTTGPYTAIHANSRYDESYKHLQQKVTSLDFSENKITDKSVEDICNKLLYHDTLYNQSLNVYRDYSIINHEKLLNCKKLPATKHIDVSGNKITKTGEGLFVNTLYNNHVQ